MAYQSVWHFSKLPKSIVDIVEEEIKEFDTYAQESKVGGSKGGQVDEDIRSSKNAWIPTTHWVGGLVWHYIKMANDQNFLYDLNHIDGHSMQYTIYEENKFYTWHIDEGLRELHKPEAVNNRDNELVVRDFLVKNTETVRKLSVVLQLSDPEDYEGGNLELKDEAGQNYFAPRERGTIIIFDSRTQHQVLPVTKGLRKSLVAWVVGPRWK